MTPPCAVKICGLTREEDTRLCLDLGADFTGFIFASGSPRRISVRAAAGMPSGRAARVGVFAGQGAAEVRGVMRAARLDFAQLHGGEDAAFCRAVGPERIIKVLWPQSVLHGLSLQNETPQALLHELCAPFAECCAMFLLDAGPGGGGSGQRLPWEQLRAFTPPRPWLLAGGIGPDNAAEALSGCAPSGLDCNSALESAPGVKDAARLRALMHILTSIT